MNRYIHPDDQANVAAAIARTVRNKAVFDDCGEIVEWLGAATDVTQHE